MKRPFCDICGAPALEPDQLKLEITQEYGELYKRYADIGFEQVKSKVLAKVYFGFQDHPTGYGGPPDLCRNCVIGLITGLLNQM